MKESVDFDARGRVVITALREQFDKAFEWYRKMLLSGELKFSFLQQDYPRPSDDRTEGNNVAKRDSASLLSLNIGSDNDGEGHVIELELGGEGARHNGDDVDSEEEKLFDSIISDMSDVVSLLQEFENNVFGAIPETLAPLSAALGCVRWIQVVRGEMFKVEWGDIDRFELL